MLEALSYPFFQRALLAGLLASLTCGIVGSYVVVKRISAISGGLSHAAFGGVGLGYFLGFDPALGAIGFALLTSAAIGWAYRYLRSNLDTLIAVVWPLGMAIGILFIAWTPGYAPDLMSYLFGSILFVSGIYLTLAAVLNAIILLTVLLLYKELQAVTFDELYAETMGLPAGLLFWVLLVLISLSIVVLIRVVGIILVIALLTIPATIARQWAKTLPRMMLLACGIGAAGTVGGLFLAYALSQRWDLNLPTGPLIIVLISILYGISSGVRAGLNRQRPLPQSSNG